MNLEEALDIRFEQRKQYLENPEFECLSNILTEEHSYRKRRDNYLLLHLLYGSDNEAKKVPNICASTIEEKFLEKHKRSGINWNGIYQYYQERAKSIDNGEWSEKDDYDVRDMVYILEKHKDKILKSYTTF